MYYKGRLIRIFLKQVGIFLKIFLYQSGATVKDQGYSRYYFVKFSDRDPIHKVAEASKFVKASTRRPEARR